MMHHRSSGCSISMSDRLWYSCIEWLFFTAERKSLADYTAAIIYGRVINGVNAGFPVLNGVQVGFNFSGHVGGCSFLLPRGRGERSRTRLLYCCTEQGSSFYGVRSRKILCSGYEK